MKKYLSPILALMMFLSILSGCGDNNANTPTGTEQPGGLTDNTGAPDESENNNEGQNNTSGEKVEASDAEVSQTDAEMFTDRDLRTTYDESSAVTIELNGSSATASSNSVKISGSTVQITEEATYIISGTLDDGMLVVNTTDTAKLQLVFNGVEITSSTSAALYILEADKVIITLADGAENSLTNGGEFIAIDDENIDAALYSKQDLTINGSGTLTVTSPAGHGIVGKDDLVITGGVLNVHAANHALDANDSVRFTAAELTATAGKDGIHCENNDDSSRGFIYISGGTMNIEAEGDGISAGYYLHITNGSFDILAGGGYENGTKKSSDNWGGFPGGGFGGRPGGGKGGRAGSGSSDSSAATDDSSTSMKGIKSVSTMQIDGGDFTIDSADDAVHSDTSLTVNGGTFNIASGDDALHAEDALAVAAGTINITTSYEALEALHITISGGDIKAVSSDDGLNAAGGTDSSGTTGGRDGMFGGGGFGGMSANSNGSIVISGGTIYLQASGDGIDANGTLEITGGHTTVTGPTQGDTAVLDYDKTAVISGGTFIGTGSSMMAQSITGSGQGVIALSVGQQSAGTQITIKDQTGNEVLSHTPELSYQIMVFSSPDVVSGDSYNITIGSQSGEFEAQ